DEHSHGVPAHDCCLAAAHPGSAEGRTAPADWLEPAAKVLPETFVARLRQKLCRISLLRQSVGQSLRQRHWVRHHPNRRWLELSVALLCNGHATSEFVAIQANFLQRDLFKTKFPCLRISLER